MSRYFETVNIAILHVPKTAGTALRFMAEENYKPENIIRFYPPNHVPSPEKQRSKGKLLVGHFEFGYQDRFFDDCELITILRNPIERTHSHLFFSERYYSGSGVPEDNQYRQWFMENRDVYNFIEESKLWQFDNMMVRQLSGVRNSIPFGGLTREHLDIAARNLQSFTFVGFQEQLLHDAQYLRGRYGWSGRVPRKNVGANKNKLDEAAARKLEQYNQLDLELYNLAYSGRSRPRRSFRKQLANLFRNRTGMPKSSRGKPGMD